MLRTVYSFFIGLLLAIFVGYGIAAFYQGPNRPTAPNIVYSKEGQLSPSEQAAERRFNAQQAAYERDLKPYNRHVALLALGGAVLSLALGLLLAWRAASLADGLLLGGVFLLLYALGRSFAGQSDRFSFLMAGIALAVSVLLGWLRFNVFRRRRIHVRTD